MAEQPSCGEILLNQGKSGEAEQWFLGVLAAKPDDLPTIARLVDLYRGVQRWKDAAGMLQRWAAADPRNTTVLNFLAVTHMEAGDLERARAVMARSLEVNPDQPAVRQSLDKLAQTRSLPQGAPSGAGGRRFNILFVQKAPCIRNYKMATALRGAGHHVTLAYTDSLLSETYADMSDDAYDRCIKIGNLQQLWALSKHYDLVHCHNEPDLLTVAALAGYAPVVHDTHDLVSLRDRNEENRPFFEGVANRAAAGRVYATPYLYEEARKMYWVEDPSLVLCNYVSAGDRPKRRLPKLSERDGLVHIVYEGGVLLTGHRNYVDFFKELAARGLHIHVYPARRRDDVARQLADTPNIHYNEPVSPKRIMEVMTQYDLGLIPFHVSDANRRFCDTSIGNKLFEYLAAGLPVATSQMKSYAEFFAANPVGVTFETADDLVGAIPRLLEMARTVDLSSYATTYESQIDRLVAFYQKVLDNARPRRRREHAPVAATGGTPAAAAPADLRGPAAEPETCKDEIVRLVTGVEFPQTNDYYERTSADGFAFLGAARALAGLDHRDCLEAMHNRRYRLNEGRTIEATGAHVTAENEYIYTMWSCVEFLGVIGDCETAAELMKAVDRIGAYPDGMMRYCSEEIGYTVPNATSAAALLYALDGRLDEARRLVDVLRRQQIEGNWLYIVRASKKPTRGEDPYHLAMVIYHLRELQRIAGIDCSDMVREAVEALKRAAGPGLPQCRRGWAIPMTYLATQGLERDLAESARRATAAVSIHNKNFRVRAIAAWALAKGLQYEEHHDRRLHHARSPAPVS